MIQVNIPGAFLHREIWLFDMPTTKKFFCQNAINRLCYLKCSTGKQNELVGIVRSNPNGTLAIYNLLTSEIISSKGENFSIDDVLILTPIIARYDPDAIKKDIRITQEPFKYTGTK